MNKVYLQESSIISPLGFDVESNFQQVSTGKSALEQHPDFDQQYVGKINDGLLEAYVEDFQIPNKGSRIQKIALAALLPLIRNRKPQNDSLLIISTTKGNVAALADQQIEAALLSNLGNEIAASAGFTTAPLLISNACVSGLMALSVAKRFMQMGKYRDAYVLAFDEVSPFIQSGFQSFQAVSPERCKPYDAKRQGVNLGEAAVASYLSKEKTTNGIHLAGDANINDANHISGPSRTGEGLFQSIQRAMQEADLQPNDIDYIVGHGTATIYNDEMEAIAFNRANLMEKPVAGFKGNYGHTLGASGLLEAVLAAECLRKNYMLPSLGFESLGTTLPIHVLEQGTAANIHHVLKTASGFAGTNTALLLSKD